LHWPCFLLLLLVLRWRPGRPSASPPIPGIMAVCASRALMCTTVLLLLSVQPPGYSAEETVAAAQTTLGSSAAAQQQQQGEGAGGAGSSPPAAAPAGEDEWRSQLVLVLVVAHVVLLVGCCGSLCTWAHGRTWTPWLVLLFALWAGAPAWLEPLLREAAPWVYFIELPSPSVYDRDCDSVAGCAEQDYRIAAGVGVLVCASRLCLGPATFSPGLSQCNLPYGVVPSPEEAAELVYVRLGAEGWALKTPAIRSAGRAYDWEQEGELTAKITRRRTVRRELGLGLSLQLAQGARGGGGAAADDGSAREQARLALVAEDQELTSQIYALRAARVGSLGSRCLVLGACCAVPSVSQHISRSRCSA
jgi:hypothetical protein